MSYRAIALVAVITACSPTPPTPPTTTARAVPTASASGSALAETIASASATATATPAPAPRAGASAGGELPAAWACPPVESPIADLGPAKRAVALTTSSDTVFWTDGATIFKLPITGGPTTTLTRSNGSPIAELLVHGDTLFFATRRQFGLQCTGGVSSVPLTGGSPTTIKGSCVTSFDVSDELIAFNTRTVVENQYVIGRAEAFDRRTKQTVTLYENLSENSGVAIGGETVFMSHGPGRFARRRADGSGLLEVLAQNSTVPSDFSYGDERFIEADATGVFALASGTTEESGQRVFHVHRAEERITQLGADPSDKPVRAGPPAGRFSMSPRHLYWAAREAGEVRRVDRTGKCGMEVVARRPSPTMVAFAADTVVWLEQPPKEETRIATRKVP